MLGVSTQQVIVHVDMDAFFASVEIRDDPSLVGQPVLVGYPGKRGVVAAASYEARKYGCHSAQPMAVALRRCPDAKVIHPRHRHYVEVSSQVFAIFDRYTPLVEGLSIDEAFLDFTGTARLLGEPRDAVARLRADVRRETGLTCSAGIAAVKFVAKIASERDKPDGLTEVPPGTEREFLASLPVRDLWGVGPRTEQTLKRFGVETVGDIARLGAYTLERELGEHGRHLFALSMGEDPRRVVVGRQRKQVSHENTFHDDLTTRGQIEDWMLEQSTRVADRLVAKRLAGRKVSIKLRTSDFTTWTRQCTLPEPTQIASEIFAATRRLLDKLDGEIDGRGFRLTGVSVGELVEVAERPAEQLDLIPESTEAVTAKADRARGQAIQGIMSEVRQRFGGKALYPAGVGEE